MTDLCVHCHFDLFSICKLNQTKPKHNIGKALVCVYLFISGSIGESVTDQVVEVVGLEGGGGGGGMSTTLSHQHQDIGPVCHRLFLT